VHVHFAVLIQVVFLCSVTQFIQAVAEDVSI